MPIQRPHEPAKENYQLPGCQNGVSTAAMKGSGCTSEYVAEVQGLWPVNEIPPGAPQFPDSRKAKKARLN